MIDKLRSMAVFTKVAELGSFRRAAERLNLSASVVSHHVTQLEAQLGAQLLFRSTRHVVLTHEGKRFYESCCAMLQAAEEALEGLRGWHEELSGKLMIVAPAPFSSGPFLQDITSFCRLYPGVRIQLEFDDTPRNLVQDGIDVSICLEPETSALMVCKEMFRHRPGLYAAPAYLQGSGAINRVEDLERADWVCHHRNMQVVLRKGDGQSVRFDPSPRLWVNSVAALHELVLSGLGVAQLPGLLAREDVEKGLLIPVLHDWYCESGGCYLVYSAKAKPHSLTIRFVEFLSERVRQGFIKDKSPQFETE